MSRGGNCVGRRENVRKCGKKKKRNIGDAERNREIKKYNVMLL